MKASSARLLAVSLVAGLASCLPTAWVITSRGDYDRLDLLEQRSSFKTSSQLSQATVRDKTIATIALTTHLPMFPSQEILDEHFGSREDNVTVGSKLRQPGSSGTSSPAEERSFPMDHALRHLEAYGRVHDYALVCAGNRADTQYCQGEFLRYSCNSYGALVQRQGGHQSETCDSICVCVNLSPKPFCISGYLGTTTCL